MSKFYVYFLSYGTNQRGVIDYGSMTLRCPLKLTSHELITKTLKASADGAGVPYENFLVMSLSFLHEVEA